MAESTQKKKPKASETRAASVSAARAKETPEQRQEKARRAALSGTAEERREKARRAGQASAEKRRAEKAAEEKRAAAARKGWETRRKENPEKYAPAKKEPTKAQKKAARSSAARRGWETRRIREAERLELARKYREQLERNKRLWSSDLVYILRPGGGGIGAWVHEVVDLILADAQAAGANPLAGPWRVSGVVEGAVEGVGSFDVTVSGTVHDRAAALAAALSDAAKRGKVIDDPSPETKGEGSGGKGRGSQPMDAAAEAERRRAVAEFVSNTKQPTQSARVTTLAAPPDAAVWRSYQASEEDEQGESFDDDDVPF